MTQPMGLFELYGYGTWHKDVGYPTIIIQDPEDFSSVYSGRNPNEYFEHFDIDEYQDFEVMIWLSAGSFVRLGTIGSLDNQLPSFEMSLKMGK
jgi:hypothetical protein